MKKIKLTKFLVLGILVVSIGLFGSVGVANAADLSFSADTTISLSSPAIDLTIKTASAATSVVVGTGTVIVTVPANATFTVTSASRNLSIPVSSGSANITCDSSSLTTAVIRSGSAALTFTITPSAGQCTYTAPSGGTGGAAVPVSTPPATTTAPTTSTGTVEATASGGGETTLTTSEGTTAKVEVPANAVSTTTTVTAASVTTTAAVSSAGTAPTGKTMAAAYNLTAQSSGGTAVTSFSQAVTVTLTYTASQVTGLSESSLKIYRWTGAEWQALATTVNTVTNTLTATTTNFSYFAIMGEVTTEGDVVEPTTPVSTELVTIPTLSASPTASEIQAVISAILTNISVLRAQLAEIVAQEGGTTTAACTGITFTRGLTTGSRGDDVKCLQTLLNQSSDTQVASLGAGSSGNETSYLGLLTVAAIEKFQLKYGVVADASDPGYGYVGPKTRAKLNQTFGL